jgi:putative glycosyltransferase (TIGR04348 family)
MLVIVGVVAILLVTPTSPDSQNGNGVTARRWADFLRVLGHEVHVAEKYPGARPYCALIALHARKSADAVRAFRADHPAAPIVIALTGTDVYPDLSATGVDPAVLALASRLIVLQPLALDQLGPPLRERARVIVQSVPAIAPLPPRAGCFEVAFLAHVRPVKDPAVLPAALRLLPAASKICATHFGAASDEDLAERLATETAANPRYEWQGARPREEALRVLARSRLMVLTSRHEGGANVISEALAAGVPVIASAIPGTVGLLGADYPGYFPAGDAEALAGKLYAAEQDHGYYHALKEHCAALRPSVEPRREASALAALLAEVGLPQAGQPEAGRPRPG